MNDVTSIKSAYIFGLQALLVDVQVAISPGIPGLIIIGLTTNDAMQSRSRIRAALMNSGFEMPRSKIVVNLAPGSSKKRGTGFELPIAVGILIATKQLDPHVAQRRMFVGELGLDGSVLAVPGAIAYKNTCNKLGYELVYGRKNNVQFGPSDFYIALQSLSHLREPLHASFDSEIDVIHDHSDSVLDFKDVQGQELAKRALIVSAVGGLGIMLLGPPGAGKSMLAKRVPLILPPVHEKEYEEIRLIRSIAGIPNNSMSQRPFRSPHHKASAVGLLGGGSPVRPGEISLAHHGVLFLDEFPEFSNAALQGLRQPLEDKCITIVRAEGSYEFPCDFQLIAASNPCPCGYLGDPIKTCTCSLTQIKAYKQKLSGPLMDRIDMFVEVDRPRTSDVVYGRSGLSTVEMAEMVKRGSDYSQRRAKTTEAKSDYIKACLMSSETLEKFEMICTSLNLSARSIISLAKVARAIADIEESSCVNLEMIQEALCYRSREN